MLKPLHYASNRVFHFQVFDFSTSLTFYSVSPCSDGLILAETWWISYGQVGRGNLFIYSGWCQYIDSRDSGQKESYTFHSGFVCVTSSYIKHLWAAVVSQELVEQVGMSQAGAERGHSLVGEVRSPPDSSMLTETDRGYECVIVRKCLISSLLEHQRHWPCRFKPE